MFGAPCRLRVAVAGLSFLAGLSFPGTLSAQGQRDGPSDLLDQVRRADQVAAQKLEADLRQTLRDAERLARSNRAQAVERLRKALTLLEEDTLLPPQRRESLKRMLRDRIRVTEADTDGGASQVIERNPKPPPSARSAEQGRPGDLEKIRQGFNTIQQLQSEGKTEAANREASVLAEQHPHQPAVNATEQTARNADQVANARRLQKEHERQLASAFRDIDRSATPPNGEIEFPKDWKERTKGRTAAMPLTAKERSLLQALNTTISVNFRNSRLEDVIEFLQTYTGQAILLDREGMKEIEVSYDAAVTLNVKGVTVRTVLRKILADLGMAYVIKDETIQATSAHKAKEMMTVRRYYVGDLLAGMSTQSGLPAGLGDPGVIFNPFGNFGAIPFYRPAFNPQQQVMQKMENLKQLIELIQASTDAPSWQVNGGSGTITFHAPSQSLVIKQSAEVHALLGSSGLLH